jgi:hypothetical protein
MTINSNILRSKANKIVDSTNQRLGQALMNALHDLDPYLAGSISGTYADPFYNNKNIPAFWNVIKAREMGNMND